MTFQVQAEPKEKHIHLIVSGAYSKEALMELPGLIWGACVSHKIEKILVDVSSVTGHVPALDRFDFSEALAAKYFEMRKSGSLSGGRMVLFGNYPTIDHRKFGETVAINRGLTCIATTDLKEGMDWLIGDSAAE